MKIQVHINKTSVSVKDRGFNYGDGIFETIRVKNNKCLYQSAHIKRLIKGCEVLKISSPSKLTNFPFNSDLVVIKSIINFAQLSLSI